MQRERAWCVRWEWNILLPGEHRARKRKLMILGGHYVTGAAGRENLERAGKQTPKNKPRGPATECFCGAAGKKWLCYVPYDGGARWGGAELGGSGGSGGGGFQDQPGDAWPALIAT